MSWRFEYVATNNLGQIIESNELKGIINDFEIEKTIGDQFWVKSGDIRLKLLEPIQLSNNGSADRHWLLAYFDNATQPFDAFLIESGYDIKNDKFNKYEVVLDSSQKTLFNDLSSTLVLYDADTETWGWNAAQTCGVHLNKIILDATAYFDAWGFSPADMVNKLQNGSDYKGYKIKSVNHSSPVIGDDNLSIVYRQFIDYISTSQATALNRTFHEFPFAYEYHMKWLDIFKIVMFPTNSFCYAKPVVYNYSGPIYFGFEIDFITKVTTPGSSIKSHWKTRSFDRKKFNLDGVHLLSTYNDSDGIPTFQYEQGNIEGDDVFRREIPMADPGVINGNHILYWSWGEWDSGVIYDVLESDTTTQRPYHSSGLIEPYYSDMLDDGGGYSGEIFYNGEDILDTIQIATDTIQITTLRINKSGNVNIEGIRVA